MTSRSKRSGHGEPLNVLMIVADTARAGDAFSTDPTVMPALQTLGEDGTRFTNAFASAPWTLPSHAGLFTGTYSSKHGAHGAHPRLEDEHRTIAEMFAANGYETFAASNNTWISGEFGFDRGFQHFWKGWQFIQSDNDVGAILHELGPIRRARAALASVFSGNPIVNGVNAAFNHLYRHGGDYGAERTTDRLTSWIEQRSPVTPFFAFVNYLEPHIQYQPPREFAEPYLPDGDAYEEAISIRQEPRAYDVGAYELSIRELNLLHGLYRGELAYVDAQIEALRETLEETGEWERTIVIVAGDHGENIGDHGFLGHQYNVYDTLLHVPLVIAGGPFEDGGPKDDLVQLTDLAATLLDLDGIEDPAMAAQTQGISFHPTARATRDHVIAEYMSPQPPTDVLEDRYGELPPHARGFDRRLRTIRTKDTKLIRGSDGHQELYDLSEDPAEQMDQSSRRPEVVERMASELDAWLDTFEPVDHGGEVAISDGAERRLTELGYL